MTEQGRRARGAPARPPWQAVVLLVAILAELAGGLLGLRHLAAGPAATSTLHAPATAGRVDARPSTPDYSGGLGDSPARRAARTAAVRALLDRRAAAIINRDRAAFLATVDPAAAAFRARQAALFDSLARVPLATWAYLLDPTVEEPLTDPRLARHRAPVWAPGVTLRYALRGFDPAPTERPQYLTFAYRDGQWYVAADDDFADHGHRTWRGLWDFGPVVAHQGTFSLILAHPANASRLRTFADAVDEAVPHVRSVWGTDWTGRVVVLIPDSQEEMAQLIGERFALGHIAAVAIADYTDVRTHTVRGQRVVINPSNLGRLGVVGRRIVLRHEITHLASRATTGPAAPIWLVEGFADYVGYLGTGVPVDVAAQELRRDVRQGRVPTALPEEADFDGGNPRLSQAYEEAWLACRLLGQRIGQDGLVRLYRMVGTAIGDRRQAVDTALRVTAHLSYDQFVALWRRTLVTELS